MKSNKRILSTGTLKNNPVKNAKGEDLGKIEEIMLDTESGEVRYAVLSFGGFLGMGDKYFAVPWKALSIDRENHQCRLDVDKETLENAPGFQKDNWPSFSDPTFTTPVQKHYHGVGSYRYAA